MHSADTMTIGIENAKIGCRPQRGGKVAHCSNGVTQRLLSAALMCFFHHVDAPSSTPGSWLDTQLVGTGHCPLPFWVGSVAQACTGPGSSHLLCDGHAISVQGLVLVVFQQHILALGHSTHVCGNRSYAVCLISL